MTDSQIFSRLALPLNQLFHERSLDTRWVGYNQSRIQEVRMKSLFY